jgi:hypothetical protein
MELVFSIHCVKGDMSGPFGILHALVYQNCWHHGMEGWYSILRVMYPCTCIPSMEKILLLNQPMDVSIAWNLVVVESSWFAPVSLGK